MAGLHIRPIICHLIHKYFHHNSLCAVTPTHMTADFQVRFLSGGGLFTARLHSARSNLQPYLFFLSAIGHLRFAIPVPQGRSVERPVV